MLPDAAARRAIVVAGCLGMIYTQLTMSPEEKLSAGQTLWSPDFIDYLFLAFNTSTAFSPTDTPVLTRWGKALMMLQSIISLTVLVLLAASLATISLAAVPATSVVVNGSASVPLACGGSGGTGCAG